MRVIHARWTAHEDALDEVEVVADAPVRCGKITAKNGKGKGKVAVRKAVPVAVPEFELDADLLIELLEGAEDDNVEVMQDSADESRANGKKRRRSESPDVQFVAPEAKRLKLDDGVETLNEVEAEPSWKHQIGSYTIEFSLSHIPTVRPYLTRLATHLSSNGHADGPETIFEVIGTHMCNAGGRLSLHAGKHVLASHSCTAPMLFSIPVGIKDDAGASSLHSILTEALLLIEDGRVLVAPTLHLVSPSAASDVSTAPLDPQHLFLRLHIDMHIVLPACTRSMQRRTQALALRALAGQHRLLSFSFPRSSTTPPSFADRLDIPFFYSLLSPAPALPQDASTSFVQPDALEAQLLPFQARSVFRLLALEGKTLDVNGAVVALPSSDALPLFWTYIASSPNGNQALYFNVLTHELTLDRPEPAAHGAILAEEPGLGKTVEILALLLLNPAPDRNPTVKRWDPEARVDVKEVKTCLIVTPSTLAPQWADEARRHAPGLRVFVYDGYQAEKRRRQKQKAVLDWCDFINEYDVCLTTYQVLLNELPVAYAPVQRPRRSNVDYFEEDRIRSPLIMCEWYRVIMDEVQMVGDGKVEQMVSMIPRLSSLAVSGTPARAKVGDLSHVVRFLRVPGAADSTGWKKLCLPENVDLFAELFRSYSIRTLKSSVRDELTIPTQTRYLVPIIMGRIERQVYDSAFEKALNALGLDARGVPTSKDWEIDSAVLRTEVRNLRGITTHPQVGVLVDRNDKGLAKVGGLKSIEEVLDDMVTSNWRTVLENRKHMAEHVITMARLIQQDPHSPSRYRDALDLLQSAEDIVGDLIQDVQRDITEHEQKGEEMKAQQAKPNGSTSHEDAEEDDERGGIPRTPAGEAHLALRRTLFARLRECMILLHKVKFVQGDVYNGLGLEQEESAAYAAAERLRNVDILSAAEQDAMKLMRLLVPHRTYNARPAPVTEGSLHVSLLVSNPDSKFSKAVLDEVAEKLNDVLNPQGALLWLWRQELVTELTRPLTANAQEGAEAEAEGADAKDAYTRSLETQGRAEQRLKEYAAVLADRREILSGERNALAAHDFAEKKKRKGRKRGPLLDDEEELQLEQTPEDEVLGLELRIQRNRIMQIYREGSDPEKQLDGGRSLKRLQGELGAILSNLKNKKSTHVDIVTEEAQNLRDLVNYQNTALAILELDLAHMRKAFNERIEYFRQLQAISDTVAEEEYEGPLAEALEKIVVEKNVLEGKIVAGIARARYLRTLTEERAAVNDEQDDDDEKFCIICRNEFHRGFMTPCAHVLCESCMKAWLARGTGNKVCPVCRMALVVEQLQRFTTGAKPPAPVAGPAPFQHTSEGEVAPKSSRKVEYNFLPDDLRESIDHLECTGSYGSKIEAIVRHLLQIQLVEPGAKSIIFSAWPDSLAIIQHALGRNQIPCLRIDQHSSKKSIAQQFQSDPDKLVLLLHGGKDNAGLNVTCASRVFLVESVVNHAFELQAIARVDRMGQTRETEVFCYYAEDTLERNILDLAARQGLSLYTKENCTGTVSVEAFADAAHPAGPEPAPRARKPVGTKGDFVFSTDDMLAILFPTLYEDIEFLVPAADSGALAPAGSEPEQPVAGPSRLRG